MWNILVWITLYLHINFYCKLLKYCVYVEINYTSVFIRFIIVAVIYFNYNIRFYTICNTSRNKYYNTFFNYLSLVTSRYCTSIHIGKNARKLKLSLLSVFILVQILCIPFIFFATLTSSYRDDKLKYSLGS